METQRHLFEHSAEIPEGLYLDLMNKLKLDFDKPPTIVYRNKLPQWIPMNKSDMLQMIIDKTNDYPDKNNIIKRAIAMRVHTLKRFCLTNDWYTFKKNPKYIK
jgi:hypothetical protein